MSGKVVFDYTKWKGRYPELASVQEPVAQGYFDEATIIWANPNARVSQDTTQLALLNMLTAHIADLYSQVQGDPTPGAAKDANTPVGRVASASEGSVSVQLAYDAQNAEQWYAQTKYGAQFWAFTAQYRTFGYVPGQLQPGGLGPYNPGLFGRRIF